MEWVMYLNQRSPFFHRQKLIKPSSVISPCALRAPARLIGADKHHTDSIKSTHWPSNQDWTGKAAQEHRDNNCSLLNSLFKKSKIRLWSRRNSKDITKDLFVYETQKNRIM